MMRFIRDHLRNRVKKNKVRAVRPGRAVWSCAIFVLVISPSFATAQTIDGLFAGLQKSFGAKNLEAYLSPFSPDIRDKERNIVQSSWDSWKMDQVIFRRANQGDDREGEPGRFFQVFYQNAYSALVEMWHVWFERTGAGWQISKKEVTGGTAAFYKLRIPSGRVERASRVEIRHEDILLVFQDCWVFYDNIPTLETGLVVIGKGRFRFSPSNATEQHQLELRYKTPFIEDRLESVYLRFNDSFFQSNITIEKAPAEKTPQLPAALVNMAYAIFSKCYASSFTIENSLTGELMSFVPQGDQVVFELDGDTKGNLAYVFSPFSEEEIHLIKRNPDRVINLYSPGQPAGNEKRMFISLSQKFDVRRCDLEVDFQPDKFYLSARARVAISAEIEALDSLNFNFNPELDILRVLDEDGRDLFYTQDKPRRLLYIYFLKPLDKGQEGTIEIYYRGRLEPPEPLADVLPAPQYNETILISEPRFDAYLYSQSASWYPAPADEDYFLASIRLSVPPDLFCVATGTLIELGKIDSIRRVVALDKVGNSLFHYETKFPVKYLSFIVGRFNRLANGGNQSLPAIQGFISTEIPSPKKELLEDARTIVANYERWFGPYPFDKLAIVQRLWKTGGGHSPASFVVLNEIPRGPNDPLPLNPKSPVDLSRVKDSFLAHEIAHQWWGQAVTWESYHDQWISEGLAQFAAVRHIRERLGEKTFAGILNRFSRWVERLSRFGPITLGSRLSYLSFEAYQAILYDKTTVVLQMLLDMLGEETFERGLKSFFEAYKFRPARTANFIRTMEGAAGRELKPFFQKWFDSHTLPEVHVAHEVVKSGEGFILKFRVNQTKDVFVFPLWVAWRENGKEVRRKLDIGEPTQEFEFRTDVAPKRIRINPDHFVPGIFND